VVDYIHAQRFVDQDRFTAPGVCARLGPPQPNFQMQGRTARALLREVRRWHRHLASASAQTTAAWSPAAVAGFELERGEAGRDLRAWRIRELLSTAELLAEGRALRHCVASYARACALGNCSIWSMELHSFEGIEKRVTLELRDRQVVQCRGRCNRLANGEEWAMLGRWVRQEGLQLSRFVRPASD